MLHLQEALPVWGVKARVAGGAGYRTNGLLERNYLRGTINVEGDESSRFAYAELSLPLIGPGSNAVVAERLMLTAAVRSEDYDSFGSVTTPKLGLIYSPSKIVRAACRERGCQHV